MSVTFYNGVITDSPASAAEQIRVTVPDLNLIGRRTYDPMSFRPHIGSGGGIVTLPTRGDKALLAIDTEGDPWIVDWDPIDNTLSDVDFYRLAPNVLKTDDNLRASSGFFADAPTSNIAFRGTQAAGNVFLQNELAGSDANPGFQVLGNGKIWWGAGGAIALDTNLYRVAADTLKTDDAFLIVGQLSGQGSIWATRAAAASLAFAATQDADTFARFQITAGGQITWGDGTNAGDTVLRRGGVDSLICDDTFTVSGSLNLAGTFFNMLATGVINFGTNGKVKGLANGLAFHDGADTQRFALNTTGISFFGSAAAAKQAITGSRGANAALASLLTGLAAYGLITDSTTV